MRHALGLVAAALLWTSGCAGNHDHHSHDAGAKVNCLDDARVVTLAPGVSARSESGGRIIELVSATPVEPTRGTNQWTVRVKDSGGQPLADLALTVATFMPDHGHTSSVKPTVAAQSDGSHQIGALDFFMPGVWRVTFDAAQPDPASLFVCVEG